MSDPNEFANEFTAIISTIVELHCNFAMYSNARNELDKKTYSDLCSSTRQKLIDFISSVSMKYPGEMKDTIRTLMIGADELEDIGNAGYLDYQHYTLEDFLNTITEEAYDVHNAIVMDAWMKSIHLVSKKIYDADAL